MERTSPQGVVDSTSARRHLESSHDRRAILDRQERLAQKTESAKSIDGADAAQKVAWALFSSTLILMAMAILVPSVGTDNQPSSPIWTLVQTPHDPIFINGDVGFTNASGVVWGSGSASDPYVISDWDINATNAHGIQVRNTSAHFVISGCYIHGGLANQRTGIYLDDSSNGTILGNNCSYNWYGTVLLNASCDNTVINNTFSHNRYDGVELFPGSNRNVVSNNTFVGNLDGIHLESTQFNSVDGNTLINNGLTMIGYSIENCTLNYIGPDNTINGRPVLFYRNQSGVTVPAGAGTVMVVNCTGFTVEGQNLNYAHAGVQLLFTSGTIVRDNLCTNNSYGILMWFSDNNSVYRNTVRNNDIRPDDWWYGIGIGYSAGNKVNDNSVSGCVNGLGLQSSINHSVFGNRLLNNSYGVALTDSDYNRIYQNRVENSTNYAIQTIATFGNVIWNNTFLYNNGATDAFDPLHIQAYGLISSDRWNSTEGWGNYWSDWTAPDSNGDGIVDAPYPIAGTPSNQDNYPLARHPVPIPEFGSVVFVVILIAAFAIAGVMARRRT